MRENYQVPTAEERNKNEENHTADYSAARLPSHFLQQISKFLFRGSRFSSFLKLRGRTKGKGEQEKRRDREDHTEHSHPEVIHEAFPEEWHFFFFLSRIEVEEEGTETELEKDSQVEESEAEDTRTQRRTNSEEAVNLVIGRELEVHESAAETETAAVAFAAARDLEASQQSQVKFLDKRRARRASLLCWDLVEINGGSVVLSCLVERRTGRNSRSRVKAILSFHWSHSLRKRSGFSRSHRVKIEFVNSRVRRGGVLFLGSVTLLVSIGSAHYFLKVFILERSGICSH